MKLHIGIDDTDSKDGFCTTYLCALVIEELEKFSRILETRLIRLNPNIPWKTRGNGAVSITIDTQNEKQAVKEAVAAVKKYSRLDDPQTNPGLVFLRGEVKPSLYEFYYRALRDVVNMNEAEQAAHLHNCRVVKFKNGRGIIGALAAVGADLSEHTFEAMAYRTRERWGTRRYIDKDSVFDMDRKTSPNTFNNVDHENSRVQITPSSSCPVLFGIRGYSPEIVRSAMKMIKPNETIDRRVIFKSNQGTDAHLIPTKISHVRPLTSVIVAGSVENEPHTIVGGHVIFSISENGSLIDCAAYEPTGRFRDIVKKLKKGDLVEVYGAVKNGQAITINLEKLRILALSECYEENNPVCPECGKRMKSSGKGQGYRCKKCRKKELHKEITPLKRNLSKKLYCVPPRAMRHLSKPAIYNDGTYGHFD